MNKRSRTERKLNSRSNELIQVILLPGKHNTKLNSLQSFRVGVKISKEVKTLRYNRRLINFINLN